MINEYSIDPVALHNCLFGDEVPERNETYYICMDRIDQPIRPLERIRGFRLIKSYSQTIDEPKSL